MPAGGGVLALGKKLEGKIGGKTTVKEILKNIYIKGEDMEMCEMWEWVILVLEAFLSSYTSVEKRENYEEIVRETEKEGEGGDDTV